MIEAAVLTVDMGALAANYRLIAATVAPARTAAVVKADGYGLGAVRVATTLYGAGCRHFFVAHLGEALALRPALPGDARLYVLNGLMPGAERACAEAGVVPVLNALHQVERWSALAAALGRRLPAVLQLDSGMSRLGLPGYEVDALAAEPARLAGIELVLVMSHLACGDEPDAIANADQAAAFVARADRFPGVPRSLDNSGGAFLDKAEHHDLVRLGIALYGCAPQAGTPNPMRAVVRLDARIIQVRDLPAGTGVGYGLSFTTPRATRIATIGVGYADGWPRHLSNRGAAWIGGMRVPVVGRVSMDSMTLDITDVPDTELAPGAPVELIGPHQSVDRVAEDAGTIAYEILTQLGHRYARRYIGAAAGADQPRSVEA